MIIVYIVIGIILLILILGLFLSKDLNYQQSIVIKKPATVIWPYISSHKGMDQWNPWHNKDPEMETTLTGEDGEEGACQHWKSDIKGVGEGKQTFTKLKAPHLARTKLEFIKPFKSEAEGFMTLEDEDGQTKATWGFESKMPYPMNILMVFMNFEKSIGRDFTDGLNKLKK